MDGIWSWNTRPYWLPGGKQIYIKTKFNLHSKQKYRSSFKISFHFSMGAIALIAPYKSAPDGRAGAQAILALEALPQQNNALKAH